VPHNGSDANLPTTISVISSVANRISSRDSIIASGLSLGLWLIVSLTGLYVVILKNGKRGQQPPGQICLTSLAEKLVYGACLGESEN
jgi:hypothetical protein